MGRRTLLLTLLVLAALPARVRAQSPDVVTLTPAVVQAGSPELLHARAPARSEVSGTWTGQSIVFFAAGAPGNYYALAGPDVDAPLGASTLTLHVVTGGRVSELTRTVVIHAAHYRTGALTVEPRFVQPAPEALKQIEAEAELKKKLFATSASEPLWDGDFSSPVSAPATDSFGTRRMFNGKLASIHKGADFRAHSGTPVHASNSGIVVLARPLYFEGNCVVIDHGLGLYTLSMHFSRIDVHEGQHVKTGDVLGLSGATGRVTGPHLHWAVRWHNAYLDPVKLLKLDLAAASGRKRDE